MVTTKNIIDYIHDNDPGYDPLAIALEKSHIARELWNAACDRVYFDGYYGPVSAAEWEEQDGRHPYTVSEALDIMTVVLDEIDDYTDFDPHVHLVEASEIKRALIPWYHEIYGVGYPT